MKISKALREEILELEELIGKAHNKAQELWDGLSEKQQEDDLWVEFAENGALASLEAAEESMASIASTALSAQREEETKKGKKTKTGHAN